MSANTAPEDAEAPQNVMDFGFLTEHVIHHYRLLNLDLTRLHSKLFRGTPIERGVGKMTALMLIGHNPGLTQASIAKAISKDGAAIARIIDELVKEGLVSRTVSEVERRAHSLHLTPAGEVELKKYKEIQLVCEAQFTEALTAEEQDLLLGLLRKLRRYHAPDMQGT